MSDGVFDVTDYGAGHPGPQTESIQRAIDRCHEGGGGTVLVPSGEYTVGTLDLKSHVRLHLEAGARLVGSTDIDAYRIEAETGRRRGIIVAENAVGIALTGHGEINGSGSQFMNWESYRDTPDYDARHTRQGEDYLSQQELTADGPVDFDKRPGMMLVLIDCENVVLSDLTLADSPTWTVRLGSCDDVRIRALTIRNNPMIANSDGIHLTTSRNVRISDCDIRCGDDAICVTGFGNDPWRATPGTPAERRGNQSGVSENVVVSNCALSSRSSGVRVGYGVNGVRNCLFQNLVIYDSNRGLGVFVRDQGSVENVSFVNVRVETRLMEGNWWGRGEAIHVSALPKDEDSEPLGHIRNLRFANVTARGEAGAVLHADEKADIVDVLLDDVRLALAESRTGRALAGNFDLRPALRDREAVFAHDIPGIYARGIGDLTVRDCRVTWGPERAGYYSHALAAENCRGLKIDGFEGAHAFPEKGACDILLTDVENAKITATESSVSR